MQENLIPIVLFLVIGAVFVSAFFFNFHKRRLMYDAIKVAIEKTGQVDAALVESIVRDKVGANADLRKGVLLIATAAAFVILGFAVDDPDAIGPMAGVASFPGLIGACYIGFHFLAPREPVV